jgi:hypothetical protein
MMTYDKISKKPSLFQNFTGLSLQAFEQLLPAFKAAYEGDLREREAPRQRQVGGGRSASIATIEDKLVFVLFYFRFYPVQVLQGFLFGMSQQLDPSP